MGDDHLESGFVEFTGVEIGDEIEAGFLVSTDVFAPILIFEPLLVGGPIEPVTDIAWGKVLSGLAQLVDHIGVDKPSRSIKVRRSRWALEKRPFLPRGRRRELGME